MNFYLRVHTNPSLLPFNDLSKSLEYFDSPPTECGTIVSNHHSFDLYCINYLEPSFRDRGLLQWHIYKHVQQDDNEQCYHWAEECSRQWLQCLIQSQSMQDELHWRQSWEYCSIRLPAHCISLHINFLKQSLQEGNIYDWGVVPEASTLGSDHIYAGIERCTSKTLLTEPRGVKRKTIFNRTIRLTHVSVYNKEEYPT